MEPILSELERCDANLLRLYVPSAVSAETNSQGLAPMRHMQPELRNNLQQRATDTRPRGATHTPTHILGRGQLHADTAERVSNVLRNHLQLSHDHCLGCDGLDADVIHIDCQRHAGTQLCRLIQPLD